MHRAAAVRPNVFLTSGKLPHPRGTCPSEHTTLRAPVPVDERSRCRLKRLLPLWGWSGWRESNPPEGWHILNRPCYRSKLPLRAPHNAGLSRLSPIVSPCYLLLASGSIGNQSSCLIPRFKKANAGLVRRDGVEPSKRGVCSCTCFAACCSESIL